MLAAQPLSILKTLNPLCTAAFQRALGMALEARHYELTVVHALLALFDDPESDAAVLGGRLGLDPGKVRGALQAALEEQRSGNGGRPLSSPILIQWIQDALVFATCELGESRVRSGALVARLVQDREAYLGCALPGLDAISGDDLRRRFAALTAGSAEERAAEGEAKSADLAARPGGALAQFATNLTARAASGELDPVLGREAEVRQMVDILCRRRKNNPILVGEPGVGKTALVEGLALRIASGEVPEELRGVELQVLDLGSLQAGASVRGEFERRLKSVIEEVKASPRPIILFIDEAHTLIGAGGAQGGGDAANLLKPALARGELRTIAATTWSEFKRYFEKDAALERRFQPVKVAEPSVDQATAMLRGLAVRFERAHGLVIRDEAVRAAAALSSRYITGRQLPDKAVDLLDTAAARARVLRHSPPGVLEDARARVAAVERELDSLEREGAHGHPVDPAARDRLRVEGDGLKLRARTLEEDLEAQRTIVERLDRLRKEGSADGAREALAELRAIPRDRLLVRADVDEDLVASVVADWTGIPVGRMLQDDVKAVLELEARLRARVRGQDGALAVLGRELRAARSGLKAPGPPLGVFLLVGPSGVGKTETALGLADLLFGGERFLVTINMSEFQERHTVSRLIGSPPGYVGFGEGGKLTEAVRQRPYSVVLLDEVEKADPEVMNLFYQVFDKGVLNDGEGRTISFSNTVVVMTSNLATGLLTRAAAPGVPLPPHEELVQLVKPVLNDYFKPALLARMTVVPYVPIRPEALGEIVRTKLHAVAIRARDAHGVRLSFDDGVLEAIGARCRDVESGARNVDHILRGTILPLVSSAVLGSMASGEALEPLRVEVTPGGDFVCVRGS
ncbi:MAG TPA: type VI secretion system ATPase TssH [Polyangiaceae bacterium]|jgi:type VI secretion system protein VasG